MGEPTAETEANGGFLLLNLPPDEALVVYGKVEGLGGGGAIAEREIEAKAEGGITDLGDVELEPGNRSFRSAGPGRLEAGPATHAHHDRPPARVGQLRAGGHPGR